VTLTGLGLKFSSIIIGYAHGNLFLTAVFTGILMWIVGLAVPVTATYIIGAVIAAPALIQLGVPAFAAHMFIFYYAVLSEVSPPTALSPFAAAALTGGSPFKTMMMAWKYTIPAFIVPFMFVLTPDGMGLLLEGSVVNMIWTFVTAMIGIVGHRRGCQHLALPPDCTLGAGCIDRRRTHAGLFERCLRLHRNGAGRTGGGLAKGDAQTGRRNSPADIKLP